MDTTFAISERTLEGATVLAVTGEIDVATAPSLRTRLVDAEDAGQRVVVVDLSGVSFIDSTALGVLVGAHKRLTSVGGSLRLVVTEPRIRKVLEITDLARIFPVFDTVDDAVGEQADG